MERDETVRECVARLVREGDFEAVPGVLRPNPQGELEPVYRFTAQGIIQWELDEIERKADEWTGEDPQEVREARDRLLDQEIENAKPDEEAQS
jgi:hypothetical protein